MRTLLSACGIAAGLLASPAYACMTEPLPVAMLFDYRPTVPANAVAILVKPIAYAADSYSVRVRIISAPLPLRANQEIELAPEWPTSCTTAGRIDKPAFAVIAEPIEISKDRPLIAKVYDRSWLDTLWSILGWVTFTPSGSPLSDPLPMRGKAQG